MSRIIEALIVVTGAFGLAAAGGAACNDNQEVTITPTTSETSLIENLKCTGDQLKQADHDRNDLNLQNGLTIITLHNEIDTDISRLLEEHGMCLRMDEPDEPMVANGYSAIVPPDKIDQAQLGLQQEVLENTIVAVLREGKASDFDVPVEITEPVERFSWFRDQVVNHYGGILVNRESKWIVTAGVDLLFSSDGQSKQPREKIVSVRFIGIRDFNDYLRRINAFLGEFDPIVDRKVFASGEMFLHPSGRPAPETLSGFDQEVVEQLIRGETP